MKQERGVAEELLMLLSPADPRDMPVPGFPTEDALIAWAKIQPADEVIAAATEILMASAAPWPTQYALMALLRALGQEVEYIDRKPGELGPRWRITPA